MYTSKEEWLSDFRQFAEETLRLVMCSPKSKSDKAKEINIDALDIYYPVHFSL